MTSIPRPHGNPSTVEVLVIPELRRQRQEDIWNFLLTKSSLSGKFLACERNPTIKVESIPIRV